MEPKLFVATKAIIKHEGKVLLLRESGSYVDGTNTGRYDVPGGRLQPGEHFRDALKREIQEETGLQVEIGDPVGVNEWRPVVRGEQWHVVGIFFACTPTAIDVKLSADHDAFVWLDPKDYGEYALLDSIKPIFEKLAQ